MQNFPIPNRIRSAFPGFPVPSKLNQAFPDFRSAVIGKAVVPAGYKAKSIIVDIAFNWGGAGAMMCREFDFYFKDSKLALTPSDYTVYGGEYNATTYALKNLFDTSLSVIDAHAGNGWQFNAGGSINNRVIIVFNSPQTFDSIVVNNHHDSGASTNYGIKDTKITITENAYTTTTFDAEIPSGSIIFNGIIPQHVNVNEAQNFKLTLIPLIPAPAHTAKSVIFDSATNWGVAYGIRAVDFYFEGTKIDVVDADITAYATSQYSISYLPKYSFITALSKTGSYAAMQWLSVLVSTPQRLICVFDTPITFDEIRINNSHSSGTNTTGCKATKINISTDTITSTVYNEAIANSTLIYDSIFDQHIASNVEDEEILILI